jgi:hypothetical protein
MYSALPLTTDIAQQGRHVRSVPIPDLHTQILSDKDVLARATETAGKLAASPAAALRLHQYRQVGERSKSFSFDTG